MISIARAQGTDAPAGWAAADYSGCQDHQMAAAPEPPDASRRGGASQPPAAHKPPRAKRPKQQKPELEILQCAADVDWERWLADHHADSPGVWLKFAKKGCEIPTVNYAQALDTALCYGWIDGQVRRLDESFYLQRFTRGGPRSKWSQINRDHVARLIETGRMRAPGQAQIDAARSDGRWEAAYEPQSRATVPDDLRQALDANPDAEQFFATLTGSTRYAFLYRLHHVSAPAARAQRIASYIELLGAGRTLN